MEEIERNILRERDVAGDIEKETENRDTQTYTHSEIMKYIEEEDANRHQN